MNTYVVAILSFFENEIKQYMIDADSDYEALKIGLVDFTRPQYQEGEIEWQNSKDFPKTTKEVIQYYASAEIALSVIQV